MNMVEMLEFLVPMIMFISWGSFIYSNNLMINLVSLLILSILLPMNFLQSFKLFWPCGMLLILISTGLVVIFAYIVSLHSEVKMSFKMSVPAIILGGVFMTLSNKPIFLSLGNLNLQTQSASVELLLSMTLIMLLIFLVVFFIRLVYSKGGGLRSKY